MDPSLGNPSGPARSGPLSRSWPHLFKKRRRVSPVREAAAENYAAQQQQQQQQEVTMQSPLQSPVSVTGHWNAKIPLPKSGRGSVSVQSISDTTSTSTASTQAEMLAQKSNYEWIASGRSAEMGLHFSTAMATGVMMRRATHRAAEQARRDRMKGAMVDLAEHLLDGEVTFGSGTSCFVVSREDKEGVDVIEEEERDGEGGTEAGSVSGKSTTRGGKKGRNINKARIIEMALEKLKAQEKKIALLEERLKACECGGGTRMDTTE